MRTSANQNRLIHTIRRHPQEVWTYFMLLASAVTILLVLLNIPSIARTVVVFGFLLFVPGWSFIRLLRMHNPTIEWTLAVALSLALDTLVAMLLLYTNAWSAQTGVLLIVGISLIGSLLRVKDSPSTEVFEEEMLPLEIPDPKTRKSRKKNPANDEGQK